MSAERIQLSEWGHKGFARAIAVRTNATHANDYPTQDKHSSTDEQDFITGFNLGMKIFDTDGIETAMAYMKEAEESKGS
jgi:hypothetical protein